MAKFPCRHKMGRMRCQTSRGATTEAAACGAVLDGGVDAWRLSLAAPWTHFFSGFRIDNLLSIGKLAFIQDMEQIDLKLKSTWGGARQGAGRPRKKPTYVRHRAREKLAARLPVHVTVRMLD